MRTWCSDRVSGKRKEVIAGGKTRNVKTLRETCASEQDALTAAHDERQRLECGLATFELTLAMGPPELMPQSPVHVTAFKEDLDGQGWVVKEVCRTHQRWRVRQQGADGAG